MQYFRFDDTFLNHGVIPALLGNDGILSSSIRADMPPCIYEGAKIARAIVGQSWLSLSIRRS